MSWLAQHCPRLAKARDDHDRRVGYARTIERNRTTALLEARRVEAHRELQLIRAFATGDRRYIAERERKLTAIRRKVAALSRQVIA